jgi:hypothetical protein
MTDIGEAIEDLNFRLENLGTVLTVTSFFDGVDEETGEPIPRLEAVSFTVASAKVANKFGVQRRRANKQLASANTVVTF